jgi:chemotaxis protein methyltransferase CheR
MSVSVNQLKFFSDYIERELGIVYAPQNHYQLEKRLEEIARVLNYGSVTELYTAALNGIAGPMKQILLDTATNNETSFFRDPKVYVAFEKLILPELRVNQPQSRLYRIWSAASSFGQEPYSIAMAVDEFGAAHPGHPRFEVFATDVADHALKRAREGRYSQLEVQRGLSASRLMKYFTKTEDDCWTVKADVKSIIRFQKHNLLDPPMFGSFDVIFCRYVLIYQDVARKKEIIARLAASLVPRGFLVLGASESLIGLSDQFDQIHHEGAVFHRKK